MEIGMSESEHSANSDSDDSSNVSCKSRNIGILKQRQEDMGIFSAK